MVSILQVHLITEMKRCLCGICKEGVEQHHSLGKKSFGQGPICGEAANVLRDIPLYSPQVLMLMVTKKERVWISRDIGVIVAFPVLRQG